jgi:hypothetical protein
MGKGLGIIGTVTEPAPILRILWKFQEFFFKEFQDFLRELKDFGAGMGLRG